MSLKGKCLKLLLLSFTAFIVLGFSISILFGYSFVIQTSKQSSGPTHQNPIITETFNPFDGIEIDHSDAVAYLVISNVDRKNLPPDMANGSCLKLSDPAKIDEFLKQARFIYTGGDMATVESYMVIYSKGELVFESGIVIEKDEQGLQGDFGWVSHVRKNDIKNFALEFHKIYWPFVIL